MAKGKPQTKPQWSDYSLIDCGDGRKLERFGSVVLIRPEPAAIWSPKLDKKEWEKKAHAECIQLTNNKADWKFSKEFKKTWNVNYGLRGKVISFNLQLTRFKHVGLFPEHFMNWNYIYDSVKKIGPSAKVLNLFAYTGGASLAAKAAGADVVHVDSIKQGNIMGKVKHGFVQLKRYTLGCGGCVKICCSRKQARQHISRGNTRSTGLWSWGKRRKMEA